MKVKNHGKLWIILGTALVFSSFVAWPQISIGELSKEWVVEAGGSYDGGIEITNSSAEPVTVEIYQSDYIFFCDGHSEYPSPGKLPRSNAAWLAFGYASSYLSIPPTSSLTFPYAINVPNDLSLVGTYWSMVNVRFSGGLRASSQSGIGIHQVMEYAIQIVTHIGDTGVRDISIVGSQLSETADGLSFQVDIENIGERWVRPVVYLEVYDEVGDFVGRFESQNVRWRIYPGASVRYPIALTVLQPGKYPAMLYIDNLDEHVWAAQVTIEVQ